MKKFLLAAAALALGVQGAMALRAGPASDGWFKVTAPILACAAKDAFTQCEMVTVEAGDVFYVDPQRGPNIAGMIEIERPGCKQGCPWAMAYVSPGDWRSAFKPAKPPKWWLNLDPANREELKHNP
jgi:hypothetical protein